MSKYTIAGIASWFLGGLLFAFQAIEAVVRSGGDFAWKKVTLVDVLGKSKFSWVNGMSEGTIHNIVQYIIAMPLYLLLFCVGILFFILGRFTSKL